MSEENNNSISGLYIADCARKNFYYIAPQLEFLFEGEAGTAETFKSYIFKEKLDELSKEGWKCNAKAEALEYTLFLDYSRSYNAAEKITYLNSDAKKDFVFVELTLTRADEDARASAAHEEQSVYMAGQTGALTFSGDTSLEDLETKLKALASVNKTQLKVNAESDSVFFLNEDFTVCYCNKFFVQLLNTTVAKVQKKKISALFAKNDKLFLEILNIAKEHGSAQVSLYVHTVSRWLFLTAFKAGEVIVVVLTDVHNTRLDQEIYQQQLKALAAYISDVREEERQKAGKEIHDGLGAILTGVKLDVSLLNDALKNTPHDKKFLKERITHIDALTTSAMEEARRISKELSPVALENLGLIDALKWLAEDFEHNSKIKCAFNANVKKLDTDTRRSRTLFRILQESLTNVARHSHATKAKVAFNVKGGSAYLEVEDNGVGIDMNKISASLGLLGMKERVIALNGTFSVTGKKNKGTLVSCSIPL